MINGFTIQQLIEAELQVYDNVLNRFEWPLTPEKVRTQLKLSIEKRSMEKHIEAKLCQPQHGSDLNGQILLNSEYTEDNEFDYMHEVMHYIFDIGIGKKVDCVLSRKRNGNSISPAERLIDYYTAATLIPSFMLIEDIQYYKRHRFIINEAQYTRELQRKYSCSEKCLMRRYNEVHALLNEIEKLQAEKHKQSILQTLLFKIRSFFFVPDITDGFSDTLRSLNATVDTRIVG